MDTAAARFLAGIFLGVSLIGCGIKYYLYIAREANKLPNMGFLFADLLMAGWFLQTGLIVLTTIIILYLIKIDSDFLVFYIFFGSLVIQYLCLRWVFGINERHNGS